MGVEDRTAVHRRHARRALVATVALALGELITPGPAHASVGPRAPVTTLAPSSGPATAPAASSAADADETEARVRVSVAVDDAAARKRVRDAVESIVRARLSSYDARFGDDAPARIVVRVSPMAGEGGADGFAAQVELLGNARHVVRALDCEACGGTAFVDALADQLDRGAELFAHAEPEAELASPASETNSVAHGPAAVPAPVDASSGPPRAAGRSAAEAPRSRWMPARHKLGIAGIAGASLGAAVLVAGAGTLGWARSRRAADPGSDELDTAPRTDAARQAGVALLVVGGAALVFGIVALATDGGRHRRATRRVSRARTMLGRTVGLRGPAFSTASSAGGSR